MATIGVLVPASPGHLNPMGSLGRELLGRGHRVVVANVPDAEPAVRAAGLEFAPIAAREFPEGTLHRAQAVLGGLSGLAALRYSLEWMTRFARVMMDDAPGVFRSAGADLLLVDQASFGGDAVARRVGVPFVSVADALMFNTEPGLPPIVTTWGPPRSPAGRLLNTALLRLNDQILKPLTRDLNAKRRAWGQPPLERLNDWFSPFAQISQQPPEFEFPRRTLPPHFHFAGPFQDPLARAPVPFPFEALDGRPLVYASMGTLQNRLLGVFRAVAESCDGLGVQLVISLGGSAEPSVLGDLPGGPVVVKAAPQLELLDRAALTVTHAGMNTVLESLARGVPMVAVPVTNDQPGVAARVAWSGSGLVVPAGRLTARRLRSAILRVRDEPSFAANAGRLRACIARCGGTRYAADVTERVLATGAPVPAGANHTDRRTAP